MIRWLWWVSEQTLIRDPAYDVLKLVPPPVHEHYCAGHDRRWPCHTDPCLLGEFHPCPDKDHLS